MMLSEKGKKELEKGFEEAKNGGSITEIAELIHGRFKWIFNTMISILGVIILLIVSLFGWAISEIGNTRADSAIEYKNIFNKLTDIEKRVLVIEGNRFTSGDFNNLVIPIQQNIIEVQRNIAELNKQLAKLPESFPPEHFISRVDKLEIFREHVRNNLERKLMQLEIDLKELQKNTQEQEK